MRRWDTHAKGVEDMTYSDPVDTLGLRNNALGRVASGSLGHRMCEHIGHGAA